MERMNNRENNQYDWVLENYAKKCGVTVEELLEHAENQARKSRAMGGEGMSLFYEQLDAYENSMYG